MGFRFKSGGVHNMGTASTPARAGVGAVFCCHTQVASRQCARRGGVLHGPRAQRRHPGHTFCRSTRLGRAPNTTFPVTPAGAAGLNQEHSMTQRLVPGEQAPPFSLPNAAGGTTSLAGLAGHKAILFFYPAAMTPGCTRQACDFRDSLAALQSAGYQVVGISPDSVAKLEKFSARDELTYPLLSDEDHAVALAYAAWGEKKNYGKSYEGLIRSTIVVDENGKVAVAQYNVRATGHVAKLRRELAIDGAA